MEHIQDVFKLWANYGEMARAIGQAPDTVRKWKGKRIPPEHWPVVIDAAISRGATLTASDLMRLNPPRKVRDPSTYRRKIRKLRKRTESRASC